MSRQEEKPDAPVPTGLQLAVMAIVLSVLFMALFR